MSTNEKSAGLILSDITWAAASGPACAALATDPAVSEHTATKRDNPFFILCTPRSREESRFKKFRGRDPSVPIHHGPTEEPSCPCYVSVTLDPPCDVADDFGGDMIAVEILGRARRTNARHEEMVQRRIVLQGRVRL